MGSLKGLLNKTIIITKNVARFFFRGSVTMSNSRYSMYSTKVSGCPLKYSFYYEQGLKGFPSCHLHLGSVVHTALKEYHLKFDMQGETGSIDDLMIEFEKAWKETKIEMLESVSGPPTRRWVVALADTGCTEGEIEDVLYKLNTIYLNDEEESEFKQRGVKMLEDYFKDNQTNPNKIVAVEKQLMKTYRGMDILAYIDKIERTSEGEIEVIDYKTGMRTKDKETIFLGGDTQSMLYKMLVEKEWGKKLKNFYFYYLSNRTRVPCNPPNRLIEKMLEDMQKAVIGIKYERFEPSTGPLCGWCDYEVICSQWKGTQAPFKGIFRAARERGRMTFSYSKMSSYKNCPYNYKKLYIDKISPKPKHFFAIGHSCHETFEEFFVLPYQSSKKQLRKMFEQHWHSEGYKDETEENRFFEQGWKWCEDYYDKYIDGQYVQADVVELYFQLPIGNDYVVIGYIDRLQKNPDGSCHILDYKTDPQLRTQEEVDNDMQLTFYYWAMRQMGVDVTALSLEFLKFNQRVTTSRKPEDLPEFLDLVNKIVGEMAQVEDEYKKNPEKGDELFPPKVNKYCGGCDHLRGCPKERDIRTTYRDVIMNLDEEPKPDYDSDEEDEKDEDKFEGKTE